MGSQIQGDPMNPKFQELAFDVVLPAHLLVNEYIEPNAKLLYGFIRNLTRLEGYCFAKNEYLADLMSCDERSIRRWLETLENEGYIERYHEPDVFNPPRRIRIFEFKKPLQKDKIVPPGGHQCPGGRTKLPDIKEDIDKEEIDKREKNPPSPQREDSLFKFSFGSKIRMEKKEYEILCEQHGKSLVEDVLKKMDLYLMAKDRSYKNYFLEMQRWIDRDWTQDPQINTEEKLTTFIEESKQKLNKEIENGEIILGHDYIEFNRGINTEHIKIGSLHWLGKIMNNLISMNKDPNWVAKFKEQGKEC